MKLPVESSKNNDKKGLIMKRLITVLLTSVLLFACSAYAEGTLSDCNSMASELNKGLPMKMDKVTTLSGIICLPNRPPIILYSYDLDAIKSNELDSNLQNGLRKKVLRTWCTTPDLISLLSDYSVQFKYADKKGTYITEFNFMKNDCKK